MITVFADASHCPFTRAAGWGAWAKGDGWTQGVTFGGPIKAATANSQEAEMAAMANTLVRLHNQEMLGDPRVMLQSDCLRVLQLVLQRLPNAQPSNHKDSADVLPQKLHPSPLEKRALAIIAELLAGRDVRLRHVKGHKEGDGRQWVNRICDEIAKKHMHDERKKRGHVAPRKKRKRS